MRASTMFPSKYLQAADFDSGPQLLTMTKLERQEIGDEQKWILFFQEMSKGIVLNKINTGSIIDTYGDETADWLGKQIVLYESETDFQGKRVKCIRMRKPKSTKQETEKALNDEVPF